MLNPVTPAFEATLHGVLPEAALRPLEPRYLEEPRGLLHGQGALLAVPGSVEEVAALVRACQIGRVGIVPISGGTGLVGGQVSVGGPAPVILSLERLRDIRDVDPVGGTMVAGAGAILADVQNAAAVAGRLFPLSLASEGSARIGGLLSTNAGGVNVLRHGNTRDLVLGVEAVLPDGQILRGLSPLRKNNTGYDLRHLLIGAEGTLGVITAATLKLVPRPAATGAALIVVADPEAALGLLRLAQERIGDGVSAFEIIARMGLEFLDEVGPELRQPFAAKPDWMCLIDLGLSRGGDPALALEDLFEAAAEAGLALDGVIAQSEGQRRDFWALREMIPEANRRIGAISSHDISVPIAAIPEFMRRAEQALAQVGAFRINAFGHLGDGNLHYNVFALKGQDRADQMHLRDAVKHTVHDLVHAFGGSISAEHGIGRLKVDDLEHYGDPVKLAAMRAIKDALDPSGIMNPGAVLRTRA